MVGDVADPVHLKRFERAVQTLRDVADPMERLDTTRRYREVLEQLEVDSISAARDAGATWRDIGALYGLSKQGAQQRFRRPKASTNSHGRRLPTDL